MRSVDMHGVEIERHLTALPRQHRQGERIVRIAPYLQPGHLQGARHRSSLPQRIVLHHHQRVEQRLVPRHTAAAMHGRCGIRGHALQLGLLLMQTAKPGTHTTTAIHLHAQGHGHDVQTDGIVHVRQLGRTP